MAIKREDTQDQSLKARLGRSFDASYAGTFLTEMFSLTSRYKRSEDNLLQTLGFTAVLLSAPMYMLINLESTQILPPDVDAGAIYTAISDDNGRTGYALFHEGDNYSLYEFENDRYAGGYSLQLVTEQDEAWFITRGIADDFSNMVDAYEDTEISLSARPWEIYTLGDISIPAINSNEEILRIASEFSETEFTSEASLASHFSSLEMQWMDASQSIGNGNAYITTVSDNYLAFETEEVNAGNGTILDETLTLLLISTGIGGFALASTNPARRRHADKKRGLGL
jgi:hypothetical protein